MKKREEKGRGRAPAPRVIRAETRLTVYRSLPYQNDRKKEEQGAPHADALDREKHVFKCNCFFKVLVNLHNSFGGYIEVYTNGSER